MFQRKQRGMKLLQSRAGAAIKRMRKHEGQALVELSLAIMFIALLLTGAIEIGRAYRMHQMLINATAEASSFLSQQPLVPCGTSCTWTTDQEKARADDIALANFRQETVLANASALTRLRDLNGDNRDDMTSNGWTKLTYSSGRWFWIAPADSTQFDPNNPGGFNINTFTPSTNTSCVNRRATYTGGQCYIVVQSKVIFRPLFSFIDFLGDGAAIRAYAIKPIVGTQ
jgi:Flp pilus assembly protein TadG